MLNEMADDLVFRSIILLNNYTDIPELNQRNLCFSPVILGKLSLMCNFPN